jgi:squalene cyclase
LYTEPVADTALVIRSLRSSGLSPQQPEIKNAIRWLRDAEQRRGQTAPIFAQIVLASLQETDERQHSALPPVISVRAARRRDVDRQQSDSTGHLESTSAKDLEVLTAHVPDGPSAAGIILEATAAASGDAATRPVAAMIKNIRESQQADGRWQDDATADAIHATSLAICGLIAAGVPADDVAVAGGVNWLFTQQHPSGAWSGNQSDDLRPPASGAHSHANICLQTASHTAFALRALVAAGRAGHPASRRAVQFLVESQQENGTWHQPQFAARHQPTGRWCWNELHSAAEPLLALSRWAVAVAEAPPGEGAALNFRLVNAAADNYD